MDTKRFQYIRKIIKVFIIASVLVSFLLILEGGYLSSVFKKAGVYPVPESYTAIFFANPEFLAGQLQENKESEDITSFTFGIFNHENQDLNYNYSVDVYSKDKTIPITVGNLLVKHNETVYQEIALDSSDFPKNSIVYVTLPFHQKSIDFSIK